MLWNRWFGLEKQSVWLRGKLVSPVLILVTEPVAARIHTQTLLPACWFESVTGLSASSLRVKTDLLAHSKGSYLVDPASSHMLVSKIKPCMSKYKLLIL